ncbi:Putative LOC100877372, partial [Caligus rogercresseyi]
SSSSNGNIPSNEPHKGIVTILDVLRVGRTEGEELNVADNLEGIVAHFIAHNK